MHSHACQCTQKPASSSTRSAALSRLCHLNPQTAVGKRGRAVKRLTMPRRASLELLRQERSSLTGQWQNPLIFLSIKMKYHKFLTLFNTILKSEWEDSNCRLNVFHHEITGLTRTLKEFAFTNIIFFCMFWIQSIWPCHAGPDRCLIPENSHVFSLYPNYIIQISHVKAYLIVALVKTFFCFFLLFQCENFFLTKNIQ